MQLLDDVFPTGYQPSEVSASGAQQQNAQAAPVGFTRPQRPDLVTAAPVAVRPAASSPIEAPGQFGAEISTVPVSSRAPPPLGVPQGGPSPVVVAPSAPARPVLVRSDAYPPSPSPSPSPNRFGMPVVRSGGPSSPGIPRGPLGPPHEFPAASLAPLEFHPDPAMDSIPRALLAAAILSDAFYSPATFNAVAGEGGYGSIAVSSSRYVDIATLTPTSPHTPIVVLLRSSPALHARAVSDSTTVDAPVGREAAAVAAAAPAAVDAICEAVRTLSMSGGGRRGVVVVGHGAAGAVAVAASVRCAVGATRQGDTVVPTLVVALGPTRVGTSRLADGVDRLLCGGSRAAVVAEESVRMSPRGGAYGSFDGARGQALRGGAVDPLRHVGVPDGAFGVHATAARAAAVGQDPNGLPTGAPMLGFPRASRVLSVECEGDIIPTLPRARPQTLVHCGTLLKVTKKGDVYPDSIGCAPPVALRARGAMAAAEGRARGPGGVAGAAEGREVAAAMGGGPHAARWYVAALQRATERESASETAALGGRQRGGDRNAAGGGTIASRYEDSVDGEVFYGGPEPRAAHRGRDSLARSSLSRSTCTSGIESSAHYTLDPRYRNRARRGGYADDMSVESSEFDRSDYGHHRSRRASGRGYDDYHRGGRSHSTSSGSSYASSFSDDSSLSSYTGRGGGHRDTSRGRRVRDVAAFDAVTGAPLPLEIVETRTTRTDLGGIHGRGVAPPARMVGGGVRTALMPSAAGRVGGLQPWQAQGSRGSGTPWGGSGAALTSGSYRPSSAAVRSPRRSPYGAPPYGVASPGTGAPLGVAPSAVYGAPSSQMGYASGGGYTDPVGAVAPGGVAVAPSAVYASPQSGRGGGAERGFGSGGGPLSLAPLQSMMSGGGGGGGGGGLMQKAGGLASQLGGKRGAGGSGGGSYAPSGAAGGGGGGALGALGGLAGGGGSGGGGGGALGGLGQRVGGMFLIVGGGEEAMVDGFAPAAAECYGAVVGDDLDAAHDAIEGSYDEAGVRVERRVCVERVSGRAAMMAPPAEYGAGGAEPAVGGTGYIYGGASDVGDEPAPAAASGGAGEGAGGFGAGVVRVARADGGAPPSPIPIREPLSGGGDVCGGADACHSPVVYGGVSPSASPASPPRLPGSPKSPVRFAGGVGEYEGGYGGEPAGMRVAPRVDLVQKMLDYGRTRGRVGGGAGASRAEPWMKNSQGGVSGARGWNYTDRASPSPQRWDRGGVDEGVRINPAAQVRHLRPTTLAAHPGPWMPDGTRVAVVNAVDPVMVATANSSAMGRRYLDRQYARRGEADDGEYGGKEGGMWDDRSAYSSAFSSGHSAYSSASGRSYRRSRQHDYRPSRHRRHAPGYVSHRSSAFRTPRYGPGEAGGALDRAPRDYSMSSSSFSGSSRSSSLRSWGSVSSREREGRRMESAQYAGRNRSRQWLKEQYGSRAPDPLRRAARLKGHAVPDVLRPAAQREEQAAARASVGQMVPVSPRIGRVRAVGPYGLAPQVVDGRNPFDPPHDDTVSVRTMESVYEAYPPPSYMPHPIDTTQRRLARRHERWDPSIAEYVAVFGGEGPECEGVVRALETAPSRPYRPSRQVRPW